MSLSTCLIGHVEGVHYKRTSIVNYFYLDHDNPEPGPWIKHRSWFQGHILSVFKNFIYIMINKVAIIGRFYSNVVQMSLSATALTSFLAKKVQYNFPPFGGGVGGHAILAFGSEGVCFENISFYLLQDGRASFVRKFSSQFWWSSSFGFYLLGVRLVTVCCLIDI